MIHFCTLGPRFASLAWVKLDTSNMVHMLIMANSSQHMTWHDCRRHSITCNLTQLGIFANRHGHDRVGDEDLSSLPSRLAECGEKGFVLSQLHLGPLVMHHVASGKPKFLGSGGSMVAVRAIQTGTSEPLRMSGHARGQRSQRPFGVSKRRMAAAEEEYSRRST